MSDFRLLMLGAMYENGGNTTHRFLDGHPQLYVYPFESQLGTPFVQDHLTSLFPVKYRWPVFPLEGTARSDYAAIIDEECKVRVRTPQVSKFRHMPMDLSDEARCERFCAHVKRLGRSRGGNVEAFFRATFDTWNDRKRSGTEAVYVGYSPILVVDAEKIFADLPGAHVLHVVRNPWSAYADTKKRPVPLPLDSYMLGWTLNQFFALRLREKHPDRLHILRIEDVMANPTDALGGLLQKLGLDTASTLQAPSWNGTPLEEVYPWGTLRKVTPEVNRATAETLSAEEREQIAAFAWQYLDVFDYRNFLGS
jgi:hypothetical protein